MLLRSPAVIEGVGSGSAELRLTSGVNPARGSVRFGMSGVRGAARIELLDAQGRRGWSRSVPVGASELVWDGSRERAGVAARGVYFARLEDTRGVQVRRVVWMGAR